MAKHPLGLPNYGRESNPLNTGHSPMGPIFFKPHAKDRIKDAEAGLFQLTRQVDDLKTRINERAIFAVDQLAEMESLDKSERPAALDLSQMSLQERHDYHDAINEGTPPAPADPAEAEAEILAQAERDKEAYSQSVKDLHARADKEYWFTSNVRLNGKQFVDDAGNSYNPHTLITADGKIPADFYDAKVRALCVVDKDMTPSRAEIRVRLKFPVLSAAKDAEQMGYGHLGLHPAGDTLNPEEVEAAALAAFDAEIYDRENPTSEIGDQ